MSKNKNISAIALLIFFMNTSLTQGMGTFTQHVNPARTESLSSTIVKQKSMVLAENEGSTSADIDETKIDSNSKGSEPESGPKTDSNDRSTKSKAAPLKTFIPTEKIPAEQAVDFPADI